MEVRVCSAFLLSAIRQTSVPIIFLTPSSLEATWKSSHKEIALDPEEYSRGLLGYFSSLQIERIESNCAIRGEKDTWMVTLWVVILEKIEEAWRSTGCVFHPPSPSSLPQPRWDFASFIQLSSTQRGSQASPGENVKWTKTRSVLQEQNVESLPAEREDRQTTHEESVKGHDTLATMTSPFKSSGPERDQLATPWAQEERPEHHLGGAALRPSAPSH